MLTRLFHIILISLFSVAASGQALLDTTKLWSTLEIHCFPWGNNYSTSYLKLSGDTVIDSHTYKIFWVCNDESLSDWELHGGLIRETNDGKVYYRRFFEEEEGLVYDFNAETGDTLEIFNYQIMFDPVNMIVTGIDSILTYDGYKKRIHLESPSFPDGETWIEDVGSIYGIVYSCLGIFGGACGFYELLCCEDDGQIIYQHEEYTSCYITTVGMDEPMFQNTSYRLYPNPANVYITVKLPGDGSKTVYIYDFFGQMVYVTKTVEDNLRLDVSEFTNGTYFVHIKDKKGSVHHEKIIIQ
jgi:hypothetical protein